MFKKLFMTYMMVLVVIISTCLWTSHALAETTYKTISTISQTLPVSGLSLQQSEDSALSFWRAVTLPDPAQLQPMPEPQRPVEQDGSPVSGEVQVHSTITGTTTTMSLAEYSQAIAAFTAGSRADQDESSSLDNFSELYRVAIPTSYPWRVACKLFMLSNGSWYIGSGMLIDPKHVMTAGHCVYNRDVPAWVEQVIAIPGYDSLAEPYGRAVSVNLMTWNGFINTGTVNDDMGIVELDRPVGALTGWHGYGYNNDDSWFLSVGWNNPSFPGCLDDGLFMYNWNGTIDAVFANVFQVNRLGCGGMSGCCAYTILSGNIRTVYGNGAQQWESAGYHDICRITSAKYWNIHTFIGQHGPYDFDLVSMDCNAAPATMQAGLPLSTFDHLIFNASDSSRTDTVTASVYLSTNNIISTGDIFLGAGGVINSWTGKSSVRVNWQIPPTIPANTATGDYFLGVILDYADANTGNNASSGDDAAPIHITACPGISSITLSSPASGDTICSGFSWTYRWRSNANANVYRIQWDSESSFILPQESTTTDTTIQHTMTGRGHRYWRVRGESDCRNGTWSTVRTLTLVNDPPAPVSLSPLDGQDICAATELTYCWGETNDASSYVVQWSSTPDFARVSSTVTTDTCVSHTLTGTGTRYWRVRGQNDCALGIWSDTMSVNLGSLEAPELVIWKHDILLELVWSGNPCATSYRVERAASLSQPFTPLATTVGRSITLSDTALTSFYRVVAIQ